jgi:hypothetical protein
MAGATEHMVDRIEMVRYAGVPKNMNISNKDAERLLALLVLVLLVGTQMPGAWCDAAQNSISPDWGLSSGAHFLLFASMAWLARVQPLKLSITRIGLKALTLALLTEGLQTFAIDRHPSWSDAGIDLFGTLVGLVLARLSTR